MLRRRMDSSVAPRGGIWFLPLVAGLALMAAPVRAETIFDVISSVVNSHPSVTAADKLLMAAQADRSEAISGYFPVVSLDGSLGWDVRERAAASTSMTASKLGVSLRQPLLGGIKTAKQVEAAAAGENIAEFEIATRKIDVAYQAVQVYLNVMMTRESAAAAARYRNRVDEIADQLRQRAEADPGLRSDVTVGQSRQLEAGVQAVAAGTSTELAENLFNELVGHGPRNLSSVSLTSLSLPRTLEDALFAGQFSHPAVMAAGSRIDQMMAESGAENAGLLPQLDLLASAEVGNNLDGVVGRNNSLFVGLQFSQKLSLGGAGYHRSESSRLRAEAAVEEEKKSVLLVREQIINAWSDWRTASDIYSAVAKRKQNSIAMVADYEGQFDAGNRSLLDFFFVLSEQHVAETAEIQARYDRLVSAFRLLAAMGIVPGRD